MNEDYQNDFQQYREEQKARRAKRLPINQAVIEKLEGFQIKKLTDFQYRIEGTVDLYPIHRRWHNIKTGKRGEYKNETLHQFLVKQIS